MLFRDGIFTREGTLPRLSPRETLTIGFGADDYVTIDAVSCHTRRERLG